MTMKSAHYKRKGAPKATAAINTNTKSEMKKQLNSDSHFCYNMTILIGSVAELETRDGSKYDGVFVAFSGQQELMLEAAHLVLDNTESTISKHFDSVIVPSDKIAAVTFRDVDLSYATRDFQLDGTIAGSRGVPLGDKEFMPWDGADSEPPEDCYLDVDGNRNGWEVQAMFKKNEENFGVVSSYSRDLAGYTTELDKSDLESFKRHEEQALQVALEIEGSAASLDRVKLENVECEEEAFSAVVRETPGTGRDHPPSSSVASSGSGKYIPPSKRQSQVGMDSVAGGSHSQGSLNGTAPQMGGGGMATRKPLYGSSVRANFMNQPSGNAYHNDRRQHDTRRPPSLNQPHQSNHQDLRRSDDGNPLNKTNKPIKGRPDFAKTTKGLQEFHSNFNLHTPGDGPQNKRPIQSHQPVKPVYGNKNQSSAGMNANHERNAGGRSSDDSGSSYGPAHSKPKEDTVDNQKPQSPPVQKPTEASDSVKIHDPMRQNERDERLTKTSDKSAVPTDNSHTTDTKEPPGASSESTTEVTSPSPGSDDLKSRKFTFNPLAKEFNPSARAFTPKSPATPPRPPNDPSSNAQVLGSPSVHTYIPMQPMQMLYNPQTGMVQGPSPPASAGNTQRPVPHRKAGLIGVAQRTEMPQQMSLQQAASLIGSPSLQPNGSLSHYAILPYSHSQVRLQNPNMVPLYTEAAGGQQVQLPVHYYPHGGSPTQPNSTQHTQGGNTVSVSVPNPHGYGQPHHYPFLGIPMGSMGWNPAHSNSQQVVASAYVPHGGAGGIPHG